MDFPSQSSEKYTTSAYEGRFVGNTIGLNFFSMTSIICTFKSVTSSNGSNTFNRTTNSRTAEVQAQFLFTKCFCTLRIP